MSGSGLRTGGVLEGSLECVEPVEEVRDGADLADAIMECGLVVTGKEVSRGDGGAAVASTLWASHG